MRRQFLSHLWAWVCGVVLFGATSCEKMNVKDAEGEGEGMSVSVRVASFEQVPFSLSGTRGKAVGDVCKRLNFLIYKDGERIRQEAQQQGDEDFGNATFRLPEGHYFLVVLAHSSNGNPTSTNAAKIAFTNTTGYTDTFLYADSLIVSDEDVDRALNLKRIVAMVRFIFEDPLPAKARRIKFHYTGGSGTLNATDNGWGNVDSKQIQWYDVSGTEEKFEIYTIPHSADKEYLTVTASTFERESDDTENVLTEKVIEGVPVKRNHITTCRGYLFSPVYKMNITLDVDDEWDSDSIAFQF